MDGDRDVICSTDRDAPCTFFILVQGLDSTRIALVRFAAALLEGTDGTLGVSVGGNGLVVSPEGGEDVQLLAAVQAMPVENLCLKDVPNWGDWLAYLMSFYEESGGTFTCPFKDMKKFTCEDYEGSGLPEREDDIFAMILGRYGEVGAKLVKDLEGARLGYSPIKRLEKFTYDGVIPMPTYTANVFEKYLGEGMVELLTDDVLDEDEASDGRSDNRSDRNDLDEMEE